jgi:hypothetical protein
MSDYKYKSIRVDINERSIIDVVKELLDKSKGLLDPKLYTEAAGYIDDISMHISYKILKTSEEKEKDKQIEDGYKLQLYLKLKSELGL